LKYRTNLGFSLVEVTLALGVAAVALLAVFALLPIGLQTNRNAGEQTAAPRILAAISADLRATPRTATASQLFGITIPANSTAATSDLFFTTEGQFSSSITADSRYHVTITFIPNPAGTAAATFANLKMTWPAGAQPGTAAGSVEHFVALARN
jgi:uncharacterized protein (TIGR02598 family)